MHLDCIFSQKSALRCWRRLLGRTQHNFGGFTAFDVLDIHFNLTYQTLILKWMSSEGFRIFQMQ